MPLPPLGERLLNAPQVAVGTDPEVIEKDDAPNDTPAGAELVPVPVTIHGPYWRFSFVIKPNYIELVLVQPGSGPGGRFAEAELGFSD